jgi:hypothetical protein
LHRLEPVIVAVSLAAWLLAVLALAGIAPLAGRVELDLHGFFAIAAALGWLAGNVFVNRARGRARRERRNLALTWLLAPPGLLFLLRAMAPAAEQTAAPFVPTYGLGVFALFFLVPVSLGRSDRAR